jgi:hypothetical protein
VGGNRGLIVIPKVREWRGWCCFASGLRKLLNFFDSPMGKGS